MPCFLSTFNKNLINYLFRNHHNKSPIITKRKKIHFLARPSLNKAVQIPKVSHFQ